MFIAGRHYLQYYTHIIELILVKNSMKEAAFQCSPFVEGEAEKQKGW